MKSKISIGGILLGWFLVTAFLPSEQIRSPRSITVVEDKAVIDFPQKITFQSEFLSSATIQHAVLEYRTEQLNCADVIGKAFPKITPSTDIKVAWTWDMEKSTSLPPGAHVQWQWRITDTEGKETLTELKEVLWLDSVHNWRAVSGSAATIHYYHGDENFGNRMRDAAARGLAGIQNLTSLVPDGNINIYLYANYQEMRDSIYYEPQWTGGMAFPEYNILILGIPSGSESWGEKAVAHELMHVVSDRFAFSCLANIPTWLNEGLAKSNEGDFDSASKNLLRSAVQKNKIFPIRSLSGGFSENPDKADLAYIESWSIVRFLFQKSGGNAIRDLLASLRDGTTIDDALQLIYGFNVDGLDAAWRASVDATPPAPASKQSAQTATAVPTFALGLPWQPTDTPSAATPTVTPSPNAPSDQESTPLELKGTDWVSFLWLAACCLLCGSFFIGLAVLALLAARRSHS
jgi:hypothetical protein